MTETVVRPAWEPRTEEEHHEEEFQRYLLNTEKYFDAVRERGGTPWFESVQERRALFFKRWERPKPPVVQEWWPNLEGVRQ